MVGYSPPALDYYATVPGYFFLFYYFTMILSFVYAPGWSRGSTKNNDDDENNNEFCYKLMN